MSGKLMHAIQYACYGGGAADLKHVEVPIPTPGKDEVLLKLESTSLNPVDWKIQKGMLRPLLPRKFPFIPGKLTNMYSLRPGVDPMKAQCRHLPALNFGPPPFFLGGFTVKHMNVRVVRDVIVDDHCHDQKKWGNSGIVDPHESRIVL